jgi:rhomboid protease GluP
MIRKFLSDTLDLVLDGLAAIGLLRGGSAWTRDRMRRRLAVAESDIENRRRAVAATHRMCRECRALVPTADRTCPDCGASMAGIPKGGLSRALSMVLPGIGSAPTAVLGATVVVYLAAGLTLGGGSIWTESAREVLYPLGAKWTPAILGGEWWRLVNPVFLHGSVWHIGMNMLALASLGPLVEYLVGAKRFLVVYVLTGIASFAASMLLSPRSLSIGASGAIFGLIGFGIGYSLRAGRGMRAVRDDLTRSAVWGVIMFLIPGIDHAAHAGGFVAGILLGLVITGRVHRSDWFDRLWTLAALAAVALPVAGFAIAISRL